MESEYYSPSIAEGKVLLQMPEAGAVVRSGWEVRLALSLGPQRVGIPQVVGESERAASINIAQRGLQVGTSANVAVPDGTAGEVIAQDPPANATGIAAPKINLLVAQAPVPQAFVMPSFVGQPLGSVSNALKDAGFVLGKVTVALPAPTPPTGEAMNTQPGAISQTPVSPNTQAPTFSPASIIVSQDPAAGSKVMSGTSINFVVR